jgi:hypothetical protein
MVDVEIWTSADNGEEAIYSVLNSIPKEVTQVTKNASIHFIGFNGEAQSKRVIEN